MMVKQVHSQTRVVQLDTCLAAVPALQLSQRLGELSMYCKQCFAMACVIFWKLIYIIRECILFSLAWHELHFKIK